MHSTPVAPRPPRARAAVPRLWQSAAPPACSGRGTRLRPPPSAPGSVPGVRLARRAPARLAPSSSAGAASRSPPPPVRARPSTQEETAPGRARRAPARPRRRARSRGGAAPRDAAHAQRSADRRAPRAWLAPPRAPSPASPGRARRARSRLRRPHTVRGPPLLSGQSARRPPQQRLRPTEIAELRHRDAPQRQRRRIVAKRDSLQRAEGITRGERARRGRDQRVHRNPATLSHSRAESQASSLKPQDSRPKTQDSRLKPNSEHLIQLRKQQLRQRQQ